MRRGKRYAKSGQQVECAGRIGKYVAVDIISEAGQSLLWGSLSNPDIAHNDHSKVGIPARGSSRIEGRLKNQQGHRRSESSGSESLTLACGKTFLARYLRGSENHSASDQNQRRVFPRSGSLGRFRLWQCCRSIWN